MQKILLIANALLTIFLIAFVLVLYIDMQQGFNVINEQATTLDTVKNVNVEQGKQIQTLQAFEESTTQNIGTLRDDQIKVQKQITDAAEAMKTHLNAVQQTDLKVQQQITTTQAISNRMGRQLKTLEDQTEKINKSIDKLTADIRLVAQSTETQLPPAKSTAEKENTRIFRQPFSPTDPNLNLNEITPLSLAGKWTMNLPAGFQREVSIKVVGTNRILLGSNGNLGATFEIQENMLVSTNVPATYFLEYTWQIESPKRLRLVYSKSTMQVSNNYTGATLTRE
ncbi:MAG TPA: hypothetical protein DCM28_22785 [Phycisphaerales bacterium]|nr:hypothetical protein [Phycisphaerales bacterium]HCD34421.1 hypothetical protein [Phycisphaerales bacterium]|tara:strand:+ start:492 stop:1337 length:846 start_codon:yes stop_codon:yes gene_type:complete